MFSFFELVGFGGFRKCWLVFGGFENVIWVLFFCFFFVCWLIRLVEFVLSFDILLLDMLLFIRFLIEFLCWLIVWFRVVVFCICFEKSVFKLVVFEELGLWILIVFFGFGFVLFFDGWVWCVVWLIVLVGCFVGNLFLDGFGDDVGIWVLLGEFGEESRKLERVFCCWWLFLLFDVFMMFCCCCFVGGVISVYEVFGCFLIYRLFFVVCVWGMNRLLGIECGWLLYLLKLDVVWWLLCGVNYR